MWCPYISSTENFPTHLVSRSRTPSASYNAVPSACVSVRACVCVRGCARVIFECACTRVPAGWHGAACTSWSCHPSLEFPTCNRRRRADTHLAATCSAANRRTGCRRWTRATGVLTPRCISTYQETLLIPCHHISTECLTPLLWCTKFKLHWNTFLLWWFTFGWSVPLKVIFPITLLSGKKKKNIREAI